MRPIVAGGAMTIGWLILLRFGMPIFQVSRALSAILMCGTVVWCLLMQTRLSTSAWRRAGAV
jgi:hypothetical protein